MSSIFFNKVQFPLLITANDTPSEIFSYNGTKGGFHVSGSFDSGTFNVEVSLNGGVSFVIDTSFALTAEGIVYIPETIPSGALLRVFATGALTAPNLSVGGLQGGYR